MLSTYLSRDAARSLRLGASWVPREGILSMDGTPVAGEPVQLRDEAIGRDHEPQEGGAARERAIL